MTEPTFHIRQATSKDVNIIADLGARTFEASYGDDNRPEDMAKHLALNFSPSKIAAELADPDFTYLLAYEQDQIIGYATLREKQQPQAVAGAGSVELARIYLEQDQIGRGYGSALMKACLQEARQLGYQTIWLGVWERNQRAVRFYEKWGFKTVGRHTFVLGDDIQSDFIMTRDLG